MKLTIAQPDLLAALRSLSPVIGQGKTLPVLSCVLLSASPDSGALGVVATNLSQRLTVQPDVKCTEEGDVCVSHALLLAAISRFPKGELTLAASDGRLEISGASAKIKLLTLPASEWPKEEPLESPAKFHLFNAAEDFTRLNAFSSTDPNRYFVNSVHMGDGFMRAANGHRAMEIAYEAKANAIVPTDAVTLIRQSEQKNMVVEATESAAVFTGENWQMRTKLIEGEFPDMERAKPVLNEDCFRLKLNKEAFLNAVKLVSSVNEDTAYEGMMCEVKDGLLTLSGRNVDRGESEASVPCEASAPCDFGVGSRNILTGLPQVPGEELELLFNDKTSAITIKGEGFLALFWQMRLA